MPMRDLRHDEYATHRGAMSGPAYGVGHHTPCLLHLPMEWGTIRLSPSPAYGVGQGRQPVVPRVQPHQPPQAPH